MITVISGANRDPYPFQGYTVAQVRDALEDIKNIDSDAVATVDGVLVDSETTFTLREGAELAFSKTLAQKG